MSNSLEDKLLDELLALAKQRPWVSLESPTVVALVEEIKQHRAPKSVSEYAAQAYGFKVGP